MMNACFPHLMVVLGSLLLLLLPAAAPHVNQGFREIPDADFEQLCSAPAASATNPR